MAGVSQADAPRQSLSVRESMAHWVLSMSSRVCSTRVIPQFRGSRIGRWWDGPTFGSAKLRRRKWTYINLRAGRPPCSAKGEDVLALLPNDFAYLIRQSRKRISRSLPKIPGIADTFYRQMNRKDDRLGRPRLPTDGVVGAARPTAPEARFNHTLPGSRLDQRFCSAQSVRTNPYFPDNQTASPPHPPLDVAARTTAEFPTRGPETQRSCRIGGLGVGTGGFLAIATRVLKNNYSCKCPKSVS